MVLLVCYWEVFKLNSFVRCFVCCGSLEIYSLVVDIVEGLVGCEIWVNIDRLC